MVGQRIVSTAPIDRTAIEILERIAPVQIADSPDEQTLMSLLEGTIGLVCRGEGKVSNHIIAKCQTLRVIGRPGSGYDTVDIAAATARKIPVLYAPVSGFAVAEGAFALLMTLVKRIRLCDQIVRGDQWQRRYEMKTGDIFGHTLGIVGLGKIGSHLARLVRPFEMTVLAYDPFIDPERAQELGLEIVELHELLERSDFVSLHVPLSEQTRGLINRLTVAAMKKGAILINTARGAIVESLDVLADALESGQLAAVGLDVFPTEPPDVSHRIFQDLRCVLTPHVVGVTELSMERIYRSMANDMVAVLKGQPPMYCVNPEVFD